MELKFQGIHLLRAIPELTDSEQLILINQLNHPVVIKYFNLVVLKQAAELALTEAVDAANHPSLALVHQAFVKGAISVIDTILSNLPTDKEV